MSISPWQIEPVNLWSRTQVGTDLLDHQLAGLADFRSRCLEGTIEELVLYGIMSERTNLNAYSNHGKVLKNNVAVALRRASLTS
ncbi:hypothetical protein N7507_001320 [Penicillium longicatenatum]|nr:hypothetical protein N7507_001320 [Penicillium longicatenatum]